MTKAESEFLSILKNAVHPEPSFTIDDPEWEGIMNTARKQNLFALIFDASQDLPGYQSIESKYFASVAAQMSNQMQKTADFLQLYKAFLSDGLSPIVMKGIICRNLYGERADFRPSGDEDILIAKEDYQKAVQILNRCGYQAENAPDSQLELIQEVTFKNPESQLIIELHLNPFGTNNNIRIKMNEWFRNVLDTHETIVIDGVSVLTLEPTDHILFLIFHAFKHFTRGGFGIRLMLDTLLFAEKYCSRINWEYVNTGLESVNAVKFFNDLIILGNNYLGFTLHRISSATSPDELLEDMLRMGTFGNTSKADNAAAFFTLDAVHKISSGKSSNRHKPSKYSSILRGLFPSWQNWIVSRPYLEETPWMVIPEWFKRVGRYLRHETSMGNLSEINESYEIAEHRLELLKKYGVI